MLIDLSLSRAEALHLLRLLDADHSATGNPLAKSSAKKVWRRLVDAGVLQEESKPWLTKSPRLRKS